MCLAFHERNAIGIEHDALGRKVRCKGKEARGTPAERHLALRPQVQRLGHRRVHVEDRVRDRVGERLDAISVDLAEEVHHELAFRTFSEQVEHLSSILDEQAQVRGFVREPTLVVGHLIGISIADIAPTQVHREPQFALGAIQPKRALSPSGMKALYKVSVYRARREHELLAIRSRKCGEGRISSDGQLRTVFYCLADSLQVGCNEQLVPVPLGGTIVQVSPIVHRLQMRWVGRVCPVVERAVVTVWRGTHPEEARVIISMVLVPDVHGQVCSVFILVRIVRFLLVIARVGTHLPVLHVEVGCAERLCVHDLWQALLEAASEALIIAPERVEHKWAGSTRQGRFRVERLTGASL
eukprot:scaffold95233_cov74-Phaeocystis_antarctica.AAC.6